MDLSFVAERLVMPAAGGHVDSDRGIVYNVRVVGPKSRNGRKYPGPVTARYAHLFEGSGVNIGHHFDPRTGLPTEVPPADRFGRLANVRPHADGLNADLKFNAAHAFAAPFVWACRHNPALYSLSVLQRVRWKLAQGGRVYRDDDGDTVAEAILEVASVDVVADGGTNETVFESFNAAWRAMLPPPEPPPSAGAMRIRQQVEALVVGEPQSLPVAPRRPMTVQEIVAGYDPNAI